MVSRKRQRSAEHEPDDDGRGISSNNDACASLSSSSPSIYMCALQMKRRAATTIVATLLASGIAPTAGAGAEEDLLHPGAAARPLSHPSMNQVMAKVPPTCKDDASYVSPSGLSCLDHRPLGCQKLGIEARGYDIDAAAELLAKCPVSCGVPPCEADQDYDLIRDEEWPQRQLRGGTGTTNSNSVRPVDRASPSIWHSANLPHGVHVSSCHAGWHPFCQDDPSYVSKTGLPCEFYSSFDCTAWTNVGYTEQEVYDLINSCPCACAVPCG